MILHHPQDHPRENARRFHSFRAKEEEILEKNPAQPPGMNDWRDRR
jgi:hypothetical protein